MTVTSATSTSSTASAVGSSAIDKLSGNFDTFLKMLTTQLQNQDPTKPMDTSEFTQQLVQYSQVEQQIKTNDQLKSMLTSIQASSSAASTGFLGKTVTVDGSSATLANGAATWSYALGDDASTLQLLIQNSTGTTVRTLTGDATKGTHSVTWDGRDGTGNKLADGTYKLVVSAKDAAGTAITSTTKAQGTVESISYDTSGAAQLMVGGRAYTTSSILAVQAQTSAATTSN